jgi:hypothetical protein
MMSVGDGETMKRGGVKSAASSSAWRHVSSAWRRHQCGVDVWRERHHVEMVTAMATTHVIVTYVGVTRGGIGINTVSSPGSFFSSSQ